MERLVALAATPDDASDIDARLVTIAQLAADLVTPVSYASVTAERAGAFTTVAASSDLALAVDEAQYSENRGPCLDALQDGAPVAVDNIAATMRWPNFRDTAFRVGLRTSLSIPLFAGSGAPVAVLNLYGHDPDTMAPLTLRVWAVYDRDPTADDDHSPRLDTLDPSSRELITGLSEAFAVRGTIQQAIGLIMAQHQCTAAAAYLTLRVRASETGTPLADIAATVLMGHDC
ncbi:MAG TPA: GAF and ANTAR domain-containing protein [Catenuloplanes sp.]